jgi:hypothetical protein
VLSDFNDIEITKWVKPFPYFREPIFEFTIEIFDLAINNAEVAEFVSPRTFDIQGDKIEMKFDFKDGSKYLSAVQNKNNSYTLTAHRSRMKLEVKDFYIYI